LALIKLNPKSSLNKAFLKVKPNRLEIEKFKAYLIGLLDNINETESEEFHKNLISEFLKKTYYDPSYYINTKGNNDLVIHNGKDAKDSVAVIIEAKKPTNKVEMLKQENINTKGFHELVLYFLRERVIHKNHEIKLLGKAIEQSGAKAWFDVGNAISKVANKLPPKNK
jgi:adenine-specific DNA-methyltransferase